MRIGLITDAHSDVPALTESLKALRQEGVDWVLSLGDALECHLPKGHYGAPVPLSVATSSAEEVAALLEDTVIIRGNQEKRILDGVAPETVSPAVGRLLTAPDTITHSMAVFAHGDQFAWIKVGPDHWQPQWPSVRADIVIHGHHHRSSLTALDTGNARIDRTPRSGDVVHLRRDQRHILNVGPAQEGCTAWAVFDTQKQTVKLHYRAVRHQKAGS